MIGTPGGGEILVLLAIGVLLFGGKLPEIMRKLGHGVTEFRKGVQGIDNVRPSARPTAADDEDDRHLDEVPRFQTDDDQPQSDNDVPKFQSQR